MNILLEKIILYSIWPFLAFLNDVCSFNAVYLIFQIAYNYVKVQYRDLGTKEDQLKSNWYTVDGNIDPPIRKVIRTT